jgi:hypothetical protein
MSAPFVDKRRVGGVQRQAAQREEMVGYIARDTVAAAA